MKGTESPRDARDLRAMAHRAVTEGVNLAYVERMRQALYRAADLIESLLDADAAEPKDWCYKLTVEGDNYEKLSSLSDLAGLIPDAETQWEVRDDSELKRV